MSAPTHSTAIRLGARPVGEPGDECFTTTTDALPSPGHGQVLLRTIYLSLDPYVRGRMSDARSYAAPMEIGDVMVGGTVCEVLDSRSEHRRPGDVVLADTGWSTHAVTDARATRPLDPAEAPVSTALGVLGMPGFTAYAGLLAIGRPQPGETVVTAAAAGPVGSAVGQVARLQGARAVGIAGGAEKCRMLTEEFGFDVAVDHRSSSFTDDLAAATPDGIDVYFENVAGHVGEAAVARMNKFGRIPVCGLAANYNATAAPAGPDQLPGFLGRILVDSLTVRGFIQDEFAPTHREDFRAEMTAWVREGAVAYREDVAEGLDRAPEAFRGMLAGRNIGKQLVRVGDEPTPG